MRTGLRGEGEKDAQRGVLVTTARASGLPLWAGLRTSHRFAAPPIDPFAAPTIGFVSATYAVIESAGSVTLQLRRSGPADFQMRVAYATADDTAIAPEDYVAASGVIEFAAGQKTAELTITIIDGD